MAEDIFEVIDEFLVDVVLTYGVFIIAGGLALLAIVVLFVLMIAGVFDNPNIRL